MSTPTTTASPGPGVAPPAPPTFAIDQAIQVVERLYQTVTGRPPPDSAPHAPIPPEVDAFGHVERQIERLLGEIDPTGAVSPAWGPRLAVWELDDAIVLALDLPGIPRDAVEVSIVDNLLTVSGERSAPWSTGEPKPRLHVAEPPTGRFRRTVALPARARVDQMNAQLQAGVLEIRIPLAAEASPPRRTVPVR